MRLRADLDVARARSGQRALHEISDVDRRAVEEAADRLADQVEPISPVSATRIREESGSNQRLRFEAAARASQSQLDAAHEQADRIQRRARAHANRIIRKSRQDASAHAPQVFEMVALEAEMQAASIHARAMDEHDEVVGRAAAEAEAEAAVIREEARQAAERIVGQAHNRASAIVSDAKMRSEIIIAGATSAEGTFEELEQRIAARLSAREARVIELPDGDENPAPTNVPASDDQLDIDASEDRGALDRDDDANPDEDDNVVQLVDVPVQPLGEKTFAALWTEPSDDVELGLKRFFGESSNDTTERAGDSVEAPF